MLTAIRCRGSPVPMSRSPHVARARKTHGLIRSSAALLPSLRALADLVAAELGVEVRRHATMLAMLLASMGRMIAPINPVLGRQIAMGAALDRGNRRWSTARRNMARVRYHARFTDLVAERAPRRTFRPRHLASSAGRRIGGTQLCPTIRRTATTAHIADLLPAVEAEPRLKGTRRAPSRPSMRSPKTGCR